MELGVGESELNSGWGTLKVAAILPDEDSNSGQKAVLGELGQRQRSTHLTGLVHKGKSRLGHGFAGCLEVRQADRAENQTCTAHPSESSAWARQQRALRASSES